MVTVLDVFDNFLGEEDCRRAADLPANRWDDLCEALRAHYDAWDMPEPQIDRIFPGSWVGHHFDDSVGRTVLGNDLLLFDQVVVHDPIEPICVGQLAVAAAPRQSGGWGGRAPAVLDPRSSSGVEREAHPNQRSLSTAREGLHGHHGGVHLQRRTFPF